MKPQQRLFTALSFIICGLFLQKPVAISQSSPLAGFSSAWNDARFLKCNTAANTTCLSKEEKDIIYILNLARTDPALFANTVVDKYPGFRNKLSLKDLPEYKSLLDTLRLIKPLPLLNPDSLSFESAKCHAISAGSLGYVGHERKTEQCKRNKHHQGECCQYGYKDPLQILMALLIDENVPYQGHRFLCLSSYKKIGVSIQPHSSYGHNTVIDFYF
ncbi:MAG TPA: hypothetical protein VFI06_05125 [Chitinophagaceae bacterium]|nr:hypothetical protein [Chitinophagaceae bacterium]